MIHKIICRALVLVAATCAAIDSTAKPVTEQAWQSLTNAAAITRQKRLSEACGWTMTYRQTAGAGFIVDVRDQPGQKRVEFRASSPLGQTVSVATVTITNGIWYVKSAGRKPGKYRPYEAPLFYGFCYNLLDLCKLTYVDEQRLTGLSGVESLSDTNGVTELAIKSGPAFDVYFTAIRELLAKVRAMGEFKQRKETDEQLQRILDEGLRLRVDQASGIVLEAKGGDWKTEFSDFHWTKDSPDPLDGEWIDHTQPVEGLNSAEIIMAFYRLPLAEHKDLDGYFLNLKTREYRRIPARTGLNTPGCFLAHRSKVMVHIFSLTDAGSHPFLVDLKSGENSPFGPPQLHQLMSMTMGGSLSPNSKAVAFVFLPTLGAFQTKRICTVDVASNTSRMIGPEDDYTDAQWLSDGKQFVVERILREGNPNAYLRHEVGILDKSEKYHPLGEGKDPVVLSSDRIVYFRKSDSQWVITDPTNRRPKPLTNVDADFGGPTVGPDRKFLLMMKFGEPPLMTPFLVHPRSGSVTQLTWPEGSWGGPIWFR